MELKLVHDYLIKPRLRSTPGLAGVNSQGGYEKQIVIEPNPDKLKSVAAQMGVTGVLRGAVTEYQMGRSPAGDIPVIAFDAELMDVGTGNVVWRSAISKRGKGRLSIVGSGTRSLGRLTQDACVELVARLRKKAI